MTTGFIPALEYNPDYTPTPFEGTFPPNYQEPTNFYADCFYANAKKFLNDSTGNHPTSELIMKHPAPIYYRHTGGYKLHVYCGHTNYQATLPQLQ